MLNILKCSCCDEKNSHYDEKKSHRSENFSHHGKYSPMYAGTEIGIRSSIPDSHNSFLYQSDWNIRT